MTFNEFIRVDKRKGILGVIFALAIFFFYFNTWGRIIYRLTGEMYKYITNPEQLGPSVEPIIAYNWGIFGLTILLGIVISLVIGYLISAILYFTILKEGWKKFFAFSKTKLFLTIGLLVFSVVLGFIAIEAHQFYLEPLYKFFTLPKVLEHTSLFSYLRKLRSINIVFDFFFNVIFFWLIWIIQMYVYSCIIIWIKDKIKERNAKKNA